MTEPMTTEESIEAIRDTVVPVIADHQPGAHLLALRLYWKFGIRSFVCGQKRNFWDLLNPTAKFLRLSDFGDRRLAAEQLNDLADGYEDCLFFLICREHARTNDLLQHAPLLESRFILTDADKLFSPTLFAEP